MLLVHDWDGPTEYEVQRAGVLVELGYAVFAADLFGAGVRPETMEAARQQRADHSQVVAAGHCRGDGPPQALGADTGRPAWT
jgi:dienelactone hydrolase